MTECSGPLWRDPLFSPRDRFPLGPPRGIMENCHEGPSGPAIRPFSLRHVVAGARLDTPPPWRYTYCHERQIALVYDEDGSLIPLLRHTRWATGKPSSRGDAPSRSPERLNMTVLILGRDLDPSVDRLVEALGEREVPVFRTDLAAFPKALTLDARLCRRGWARAAGTGCWPHRIARCGCVTSVRCGIGIRRISSSQRACPGRSGDTPRQRLAAG